MNNVTCLDDGIWRQCFNIMHPPSPPPWWDGGILPRWQSDPGADLGFAVLFACAVVSAFFISFLVVSNHREAVRDSTICPQCFHRAASHASSNQQGCLYQSVDTRLAEDGYLAKYRAYCKCTMTYSRVVLNAAPRQVSLEQVRQRDHTTMLGAYRKVD